MTPNDKLDLQVSEEQDGSAVVKMPAGESPDDNRNDAGDDKTLSNTAREVLKICKSQQSS
jgi:hypothetical protein